MNISLRISTEKLIHNNKARKSFRDELKTIADESLELYISSIDYLNSHKRFTRIFMEGADAAIASIKSYYAHMTKIKKPDPKCIPCILLFKEGDTSGTADFSFQQVPIGEASAVAQWALL